MKDRKRKLSPKEHEDILEILKERFEKNLNRHKDIEWDKVQDKLEINAEKLWSLYQMDVTGGEPDVTGYDKENDEYIFCDCSEESPKGPEAYVMMVKH